MNLGFALSSVALANKPTVGTVLCLFQAGAAMDVECTINRCPPQSVSSSIKISKAQSSALRDEWQTAMAFGLLAKIY